MKDLFKTGVYFLISREVVVYIGQTKRWPLRLSGHSEKEFDNFRFIECDPVKRLYYESRWIKYFSPKYNNPLGRKRLPKEDKKIGVSVYLEKSKVENFGGRAGAVAEIIRCLDFSGSSLL